MSAPVRIESLIPQPLPDLRRVSITLRVSGLPAYGPATDSNLLHFPDMPGPGEGSREQEPYPSPPARDLYFVSKGQPTDPLVIQFLLWILKEGQKHVKDAGYVNLSPAKIDQEISRLQAKQ